MNIKKAVFFTGIMTGVKILSGVVMNKIIAVQLGPSGLALLGQFQNFVTIASAMGNASTQTGVVKYTAEYSASDGKLLKKMLQNAFFLNLICSLVVTLIIFIGAPQFSKYLMDSIDYSWFFYIFGASILFYSLNIYVLSVLNGLGAISLYTFINIVICILTLLLSIVLTALFGLPGALLASILIQSVIFIITVLFTFKSYAFIYSYRNLWKNIDLSILKKLLSYSMATFCNGVIVSLAAILVRTLIQEKLSLEAAGIWEGAYRIGLYYNLVFMTSFTIYYFPKFSAAKNKEETKAYLREAYRYFIPFMSLALIVLFFFREPIVGILFSQTFKPMTQLLLFIGLGSMFNVLAMILSTVVLAKENIFFSIISSLSYNTVLIFGCFLMLHYCGFMGLGYGFLGAGLFWFFLNHYLYKIHRYDPPLCMDGSSKYAH